LKGAGLLGLAAADCVVFEDAPAGIRAGKAAGAKVIALQTTERDNFLRDAGADWIVKDCASVSVSSSPLNDEISLTLSASS
jgi:beta-phosphoglucomutase-like phosphatase (HAD superfamily)